MIGRRELITLLCGAATWPRAVHAQQSRAMPRIGYLSFAFGSLGANAFREGLRALGYLEGKNVLVEDRRAGNSSQLNDLAAELVVDKVDIIVCGGSQATRAALAQTKAIPIVTLSSDPVAVGFVASLARPGGNVTGVSLLAPAVAGKRLALLKELIPAIRNVAVLWNPDDPTVTLPALVANPFSSALCRAPLDPADRPMNILMLPKCKRCRGLMASVAEIAPIGRDLGLEGFSSVATAERRTAS